MNHLVFFHLNGIKWVLLTRTINYIRNQTMTLWLSPFSPAEAKSLLQSSPSQSHTWIVWTVTTVTTLMLMLIISPLHPPRSQSCSAYLPGLTPKSSHAASLHCHLQLEEGEMQCSVAFRYCLLIEKQINIYISTTTRN